MSDAAVRLRPRLDTDRRRWQTDHGAIAVQEVVAIVAVAIIVVAAVIAILDVAGFDVGGWMREQLGVTSVG